MKKILSLCLALMICLIATHGIAESLLGDLDARLEPMKGSDFYLYSQLNSVSGKNRIVYDATYLYFAWGNSLYCANYDGTRVWELTDTLADDTPIALQGDRIYCITNAADIEYVTAIKTDGSELPDRIMSCDQLWKSYSGYGSKKNLSGSFTIGRIVVPKNSGGNVYFTFHLRVRYYDGWNMVDRYQIGIASYNIGERTFTFGRTVTEKNDLNIVDAFWYQNGILTYEMGNTGISRYDLAETEPNVISNSHPKRLVDMLGRIYFIEKDTGRFYSMAYTGSQKMKLMDGVAEFVLTGNGLLVYSKDDGLYAADGDALDETLITNAITGRFYLMGDWVYYYTNENLQRLSLLDGTVQVVFDPSMI